MARILFDGRVLAHAQKSGVERYASEISRRLVDARSEHSVAVARPPTRAKAIHHLWEHFYLPFCCVDSGFDLLFCPANIAPMFWPSRVKVVVTAHGIAFRYSPESYSQSFYYYYSCVVPRSLKSADAVIAVSSAEKKSILTQYPFLTESKIHVVPNGIDPSEFNPGDKEQSRQIIELRYGISGEFLLAVGSFKAVKNFNRLIEAFSSIYDRVKLKLVLLGSGEKGIAQIRPNILTVGYIDDDMANFYRAANCLVCPSTYEGFGFPALEAMACGCPVIASNAGALPEICGDAACFVDPHDTKAIADAIIKVTTDDSLKEKMIERGLRRAKEFTWERTVQGTLKVFDKVLAAS